MAYEYVNQHYGLQVEPGMRVKLKDRLAITRRGKVLRNRTCGHRVRIRLDDGRVCQYHPYDLEYDFLRDDTDESFRDWLLRKHGRGSRLDV